MVQFQGISSAITRQISTVETYANNTQDVHLCSDKFAKFNSTAYIAQAIEESAAIRTATTLLTIYVYLSYLLIGAICILIILALMVESC